MARLKLYWSKVAKAQRDHIFNYWIERTGSFSYAKTLNKLIIARTTLINAYPQIGKKTNYSDVRVSIIKHYSIIYIALKDKIIILGFWDNRQDSAQLKKFIEQQFDK
ncbi:type II toxin-antitoxin system RelE/ParE family toxin [Salibacter sp.]|uniref:type II toxin-antitoxin system RelE/ParE family toxin n=1 Tax=Salibacter sp. TaxID=2010995 RepID=UPI002870089D|nr:type II toxin-antitoxin system RelE/ParE family toxin [Salibacter sp.]MDR9399020.1 type II toxin-antitoxin system RelE/ParE family toxin [Salibacter sp.]MDR9487314.1 type II toxin-antitoxin system RelE/ParE family toxin [Salibacter sp.]